MFCFSRSIFTSSGCPLPWQATCARVYDTFKTRDPEVASLFRGGLSATGQDRNFEFAISKIVEGSTDPALLEGILRHLGETSLTNWVRERPAQITEVAIIAESAEYNVMTDPTWGRGTCANASEGADLFCHHGVSAVPLRGPCRASNHRRRVLPKALPWVPVVLV